MRPPSLWQILIVVLIIVLIFGAKRLPDLASSVGKSLKIFKKEVSELREDEDTPGAATTTEATQQSSTPSKHESDPPGPTAGGPGSDHR